MKRDIRDLTKSELVEAIVGLQEKPFRAKQIWEWLWKKGARSFEEMSTLPVSLRQALADQFLFQVIALIQFIMRGDDVFYSRTVFGFL